MYGAIINAGITVGPVLSAVVLLFGSASTVLLINAVTFLMSGALMWTVPLGGGGGGGGGGEAGEAEATALAR